MDRKELDANHAKLRGKAKLHEGAVTRARLRANHEAHQKNVLASRADDEAAREELAAELRAELREELKAGLLEEVRAELREELKAAEGEAPEDEETEDDGPPALL